MNDSSEYCTRFGRVLGTGAALFAFGVAFDQFTDWFTRRPEGESRSAFLVVIGTAVTVAARQLMPRGVGFDLYAFGCSGLPMIWGQYARFEKRKRAAVRRHLARTG